MANATGDLHIVMLPWSGFGHMIPFFQLAISLAKHGLHVTYISTPKNIERLPKIPPHLTPLVQYVCLPLPVALGNTLPLGAEATFDVEYDRVQYLKLAYDLLRYPVKQFVSSHSPDWIISDFTAHWLPEIARECQVPLMYFSIFPATVMSFLGPPENFTLEAQKRVWPTPDTMTTTPVWGIGVFPPTVAYRSHEAAQFHRGAFSNNASGVTDAERMGKVLQGCQAVCIRSCREFEGEYIDLYERLLHKRVVPVGVLPPTELAKGEDIVGPWCEVLRWLDQQMPRSVVYVGFGSETKLTKDEVYEIAYGLELASLPFIWILRRPAWAANDSEALPPGFENRTSGKGITCIGWAPQRKILAHPSVGGSLFHCGLASIVELLQHGHSLILLPWVYDQGLNARLLVEKGLGVEIERREDGSFAKHDIANTLRRVMLGDEAERIRARAKQAAVLFGDEKLHQEHYIGGMVEFLRTTARHQ